MNKKPLSIIELKKIIQTTQAIEGYKPANIEVIERVKKLRARYAIQVSPRK
jgi:hypothetical protein